MKNSILIAFVILAGLTGCGGDSHLDVELDRVALGKEYLAILQSATDDASAKAAASKIEAIAVKLAALKKREEALGDPTEDEFKRMADTVQKGGGYPSVEVAREHSRIARNAALRAILAPAMNKVNE